MGVEPMNTGFADQRVSHFATGALVVSVLPATQPKLHDGLFDKSQIPLILLCSIYFGCATVRRYGFTVLYPGKILSASSLETAPVMITSSPCFQFAGVATLCFAVNCIESSTRMISSKLRPVVIGYASVSLMRLSGPTTKTVRTGALSAGVRPSQLSPASLASMSYSLATFNSVSPMIG